MKKQNECSASGLIIESGMENDTISAKDHRKVCFSERFVNDPLKNLALVRVVKYLYIIYSLLYMKHLLDFHLSEW